MMPRLRDERPAILPDSRRPRLPRRRVSGMPRIGRSEIRLAPSSHTVRTQFLPQHTPQRVFEGGLSGFHVLPESPIDERLVVPAAGLVDLRLEPRQNIMVQSDGDPTLACRGLDYRPALPTPEVIFFAHRSALVLPPLPRGRPASGDDSNHVTTPSVDHDENVTLSIAPDRDEAGFLRSCIEDGDRERIVEDRGGVREVNTVLLQVGAGLVWIPLELHRLIVCTLVHIVNLPAFVDFPYRSSASSRSGRIAGSRDVGF